MHWITVLFLTSYIQSLDVIVFAFLELSPAPFSSFIYIS